MMGLVSDLYKIARIMNDFKKLSSGNPDKIAKRVINKYIGRKIVSKIYLK